MSNASGEDRGNWFGMIWGLFLGIGMSFLTEFPPQPLLGVVFWIAVAVLNARIAVLAWNRLGFRIFGTFGMVAAAILIMFAALHA